MEINNDFEYDYLVKRGHEPLLDERIVTMTNRLRREIQKRLFGTDRTKANAKFYKWVWDHKPHRCEECMRPLEKYSAVFVSHILTRGAFPEMAHDPRNVNILCFEHHNQWENGNRKAMRIYEKNQETIERLKKEYADEL